MNDYREKVTISPPVSSTSGSSSGYIIIGIVVLIAATIIYLLSVKNITNKVAPQKTLEDKQEDSTLVLRLKEFETIKRWQYTESMNKDSFMENRTADLYSDQSLRQIDTLAKKHDYYSEGSLSYRMMLESNKYEKLSIYESFGMYPEFKVTFLLPYDIYEPFIANHIHYLLYKFDSDKIQRINLDDYLSFKIELPAPKPFFERLKHSKNLTVLMASNRNAADTLQMSFHTDSLSLKWRKIPKEYIKAY